MMMRQLGGGSSSSSTIRCQDCGNQSKRDCAYTRCRTCCKTKGFQCQTHIKSTWLPSSSRRHQSQPNPPQRPIPSTQGCGAIGENLSGSGSFPAETSFPATFRCVKVSSIDVSADHYAYQTSVNIGGHVFRGILYDQGPDSTNLDNSNIALAAVAGGGAQLGSATSGHDHDDQSQLASSYPFHNFNAFMPGTNFFPSRS